MPQSCNFEDEIRNEAAFLGQQRVGGVGGPTFVAHTSKLLAGGKEFSCITKRIVSSQIDFALLSKLADE